MGKGILSSSIHPILGAIRSVPVPPRAGVLPPAPPVPPFITVSRQAGAGARYMAKQLLDALNQALPGEQPWSRWDRELIEKVASDLHLPASAIDRLEDQRHTWFSDLLGSLSFSDEAGHADETKIYARVKKTILALAQAGRVVIVGSGGVFVTRRMPGGIHVRLVAPFEERIRFMASEYHLTADKAAARVKEIERNRAAFYKQFWPNETLGPETFTVTFNTAMIDTPTMVQTIIALARQVAGASSTSAGTR